MLRDVVVADAFGELPRAGSVLVGDVWRDFDKTRPADPVPAPDGEPDVIALEADDEVVAVER